MHGCRRAPPPPRAHGDFLSAVGRCPLVCEEEEEATVRKEREQLKLPACVEGTTMCEGKSPGGWLSPLHDDVRFSRRVGEGLVAGSLQVFFASSFAKKRPKTQKSTLPGLKRSICSVVDESRSSLAGLGARCVSFLPEIYLSIYLGKTTVALQGLLTLPQQRLH